MIDIKNILIAGMVGCTICATTSCSKNEYGTVDLTMDENYVDATYVYTDVVGMYSTEDYARVKQSLSDNSAPAEVQTEYNNLKSSPYVNKSYVAKPHVQLVRGDATGTTEGTQTYKDAMKDAAAAYQMALLWKIDPNATDAADYALAASKILTAWASTCKEITSNDADYNLAAGAQGYTFALAGQMLMDFDGWSSADKSSFKTWMKTVFGATNLKFLDNHAKGSSFEKNHANVPQNLWDEHYWSNWDMVNLASYLSIGILCEDDEIVNYVVNYFYSGSGNGCITKLIRGTHTDPLGTGETICQNQESGRDQSHAQMSMAVCAHLCQIAYQLYLKNPSVTKLDFFAAENNAVLHMAEYVALSNLRDGTDDANNSGNYIIAATDMPFTEYHHCPGASSSSDDNDHITLSEEKRGGCRPGWEIIMAHYGNQGTAYSKIMADKIRPEGGAGDARYGGESGAFDQIGWGTLMLYQE